MSRAKRAVIMAAGAGKRMQPVSLDIPKPLIPIHGKTMIETVIEGLHDNNIYDISIVVGYKKEQFHVLKEKYEQIRLIDNPYYDSSNNISSLYCARNYLENSIIADGDQILYNPKILRPEFEYSGYCSAWNDSDTTEWMQTVQSGIVTDCSRTGGKNAWQLFSISFWKKEDAEKLKRYAEIEFMEKKNRDIYWDDIAMFLYKDEFQLGIREIDFTDIREIDSYKELVEIDRSYAGYGSPGAAGMSGKCE